MRILIADDHGIVRQGLRALIDAEIDMKVVGEATDGRQAVELARQLSPDVIVMDVTMPALNGIEATRLILTDNPKIRIVALSVHNEGNIVKQFLTAGAVGYVLKTYLFEELSRAIRTVMVNGYYLSPKVANVVATDYLNSTATVQANGQPRLTAREREIVQLIAEGKSVKQIAMHLHLSPKTIDANRRVIMEKLDVASSAEITKYAIVEGLTALEFGP